MQRINDRIQVLQEKADRLEDLRSTVVAEGRQRATEELRSIRDKLKLIQTEDNVKGVYSGS